MTERKNKGGRAAWLEIKDMFAGLAFPFIVTVIISSSIISYAAYGGDEGVKLLAICGGEVLLAAALIIFGRANGSEAYRKTVEHDQMRELNSSDERVLFRTGEYALWKSAAMGAALCLPYYILLTVQLIVPNSFCGFCLEYVFCWAYYPFSYLGSSFLALDYIMILFPVCTHMLGYYLGKLKQIKIQEALAATNPDRAKKRKK